MLKCEYCFGQMLFIIVSLSLSLSKVKEKCRIVTKLLCIKFILNANNVKEPAPNSLISIYVLPGNVIFNEIPRSRGIGPELRERKTKI